MKTMLRLSVAVCALAVAATVARADIAPVWSDDQLAQFSSAIVSGRVTDVSVGRDIQTGGIYTYVTLAVDEALKGDVSERNIVIKQLGGLIGDTGLAVLEQALFSRGEDVLVFLETRPRDGTLYTTALWQGKWTLGRAVTGEPVAERQSPEGGTRGAFRGAAERRTLSLFTTRLRASRGAVSLRDFVTMPAPEEMRSAVSESTAGAPFVLFSPPWRWNEFDTNTAIPVDVQAGGNPSLSGGGFSELNRAMGIWSAPTGLRFSTGGTSSRCFGTGDGTGHISIVFLDPCGEISDSGGTLAIGGASYFTAGRTVNGIAFGRAVDGYIVNNDSAAVLNFMQNSNCFASVDTHELGHVLGLAHSPDSTAIMFASVSFSRCSVAPVPISADDITGIRTIYPPAPVGSAPGAPTGLVSSSSGSTVLLAWVAAATGGPPSGYLIEAGSSAGLANLASFNTGNTATSFSTSGVPAGVYLVRVKATNASGTSAPSNESTLIVGAGCATAPGPPSGLFTVSNSGGTVVLAWTGSLGSPTTYLLEAGSSPGLSNLANFDLGGTALGITASAPRGTYFVRVRGRNSCGTSPPSNEIVVIVP